MNTILFDLDGTLLPMDQDLFVKTYFKSLTSYFIPFNIAPDAMITAINIGIQAMVLNDGSMSNEKCFWKAFSSKLGDNIQELEPEFIKFYATKFNDSRQATKQSPFTPRIIQTLKEKGYTIVIATNPLFPQIATYSRIGWAGFEPSDATYVTTYETCCYSKPNLSYYTEILEHINKKPEECMMVGNDVREDMQVHKLGLDRYLVTDCLLNPTQEDLTSIPHGTMEEFYEYVQKLPKIN